MQEIMLENCKPMVWNKVEREFLEGCLCVNAGGRLRGLLVAWNEEIFTKEDAWLGHFAVPVKLKRRMW